MQSPKLYRSLAAHVAFTGLYPLSYAAEKAALATYFRLRRTPSSVASLNGSFWLFSLDRFARIGLFDEGTFLYHEEDIVGRLAHRKGYRIVFMPLYRFVHDHGQTTRRTVSTKRYYALSRQGYSALLGHYPVSAAARRFAAAAYAYRAAVAGSLKAVAAAARLGVRVR